MLPLLRILEKEGEPFFSRDELDEACRRALVKAAAELRRVCGRGARRWRLNGLRTVAMRHPMSDVPVLGPVVTVGPVPWAGDGSTVNCASMSLDRSTQAEVGPVFRHAVECGDWDAYRVIMATGQGGDPTTGRYREMFTKWRAGGFVVMPFSAEGVRREEKGTAVLVGGGA